MNIEPGKLWDQEVEKALNAAACVLFIATEKSTTSNNVLNEVYYALEENKQVIPIIAAKCTLPFRLKRLQYIDFTSDYEISLNQLLIALHLEARKSEKSVPDIKQPVLPNSHEDEEERFWKHILGRNNLFSYEDYLSTYPHGKYSTAAMQRVKELQPVEPLQTPQPNQPDPNTPGKSGSIINKKWISIAIVAIVVGILGWLLTRLINPGPISPIQVKKDSNAIIKARNVQNVLGCLKALSTRDVNDLSKYFSTEIVLSQGLYSGSMDIGKFGKAMGEMVDHLSNLKTENERTIAEDDSVQVYAHWTLTFKSDRPIGRVTGKQVSFDDNQCVRFNSEGKIIACRYTTALADAVEHPNRANE